MNKYSDIIMQSSLKNSHQINLNTSNCSVCCQAQVYNWGKRSGVSPNWCLISFLWCIHITFTADSWETDLHAVNLNYLCEHRRSVSFPQSWNDHSSRALQPCLNQMIRSCAASPACLSWESWPTFSTWGWCCGSSGGLQGRTLFIFISLGNILLQTSTFVTSIRAGVLSRPHLPLGEAEEQLGRVLPARLQANSCSGLGLPHDDAHHLALLLSCPVCIRAERRAALPQLALLLRGLCSAPQLLQQTPEGEIERVALQRKECKYSRKKRVSNSQSVTEYWWTERDYFYF